MQALEGLGGSAEQKRLLGIARRQLAHLTRLVGDLSDASRIGNGKVQLQLEDIAIGDAVSEAVQCVRHMFEERGQELTVALPAEPVWVRADADRLEQVIINLLANAAKYTENGGRVSLSIERQAGECTVRVRDTGIGISPELLPRIFDLFIQGAPSLGRSKGGLGIGLALVKRLVELHQGRVEAHSIVGAGSEFVVTLPALRSPQLRQSATIATLLAASASSPP